MNNTGVVAIIPARGGSKGIPRKNLADLMGRPLIYYTLESALEVLNHGSIDRVIVSTDDEEIARYAINMGAEVPWLRPADLSDDYSRTVDVVIDAVQKINGQAFNCETIILLQPTSPLRTAQHIEKALALYREGEGTSLISVYREDRLNELMLYHKAGQFAEPLHSGHSSGMRRQDISPLFVRNGAIYISDVRYLLENRRLISDHCLLFEMGKAQSVNIDSLNDLDEARKLLCE